MLSDRAAPRLAIKLVLIGIAYGLLAWIGITLRHGDRFVALWLPNAVVVAVLLRGRRSDFIALIPAFLANWIAGVLGGVSPMVETIVALVNMAEIVAACVLIRRTIGPAIDVTDLAHLTKFSLIAGLLVPAISGIPGTLMLSGGQQTFDLHGWGTWIFAHGLGMLIVVPTLLVAQDSWRQRSRPTIRRASEWVTMLLAVMISIAAIFAQSSYPFLFLACPVILVASFRLGAAGMVASVGLTSVVAAIATYLGSGPIHLVHGGFASQLVVLQLFLATNYAIGFTVSAALFARDREKREAEYHRDFAQKTLSSMRDVIFRTDVEGRWTFLNPAWTQLTGYEVKESLGRSSFHLLHTDDHDALRDIHGRLAARELAEGSLRQRFKASDGSIRHIETGIRALFDDTGQFTGIAGNIRDVTEQHVANEALAKSQRRFETLARLSPAGIFRTDTDGLVTYVNDSWLRLSGLTRDDAMGPGWASALPPDDRLRVQQGWAEAVERDEGYSSEFRFSRPDGTVAWVAVVSAPDLDEVGTVVGHIGVNIDITRSKAIEDELISARERAEAAARAKASFLANMSHEIRTPMNGVIGFTDLLLASGLTDEQRRHAQLIADSGKAMMRLLNDILDLSKAEAGQMKINREPLDLRQVVRGCTALMSGTASDKGLVLDYDIAPEVPAWILADGLRLRQVVLNLLGNALKFTKRGHIIVRSGIDPAGVDRIFIEVDDTGIGIPRERQAAIFEEFVQASETTARDHGGTGLGLTISNRLVHMMGGSMSLDSESGRGSCFRFTLDAVPCEPPIREAEAGRGGVTDRRRSARIERSQRVLLAEDHDINQALMIDMLRRPGRVIDVAEDGVEAVAMVKQAASSGTPYDIVLMDIQMPRMGGIEATREIRSAGFDAATLPIIALTANAYVEDRDACLAAGMQAHLAKPVDVHHLDDAFARWVDSDGSSARQTISPSASLRAKYEARKRDTLDQIAEMIRSGSFSDETLSAVGVLLHKLAGTAGMFGETALGELAHEFEDGLLNWDAEDLHRQTYIAFEQLKSAA